MFGVELCVMAQPLGHDVELRDILGGKMLTPQQVARRLEVDLETLRRWARQGKGPPFVLVAPSTKRYPEDGLLGWMHDHLRPQVEVRAS